VRLVLKVDRHLGYNRTVRKLLHVAGGLPALLLPWLPYWLALAAAIAVMWFGLWLKPRHAWWLRYISKPADRNRNVITGMRGYCFAILLLILAWPAMAHLMGGSAHWLQFGRLGGEAVRYVMFGWMALSFGDGLAGMLGPGPAVARTVPWNVHKTWWGLLGGILGSCIAFWICFAMPLPQATPFPLQSVAWVSALVGVFVGVLESLDLPVDDNYVVGIGAPLVALLAGLRWL